MTEEICPEVQVEEDHGSNVAPFNPKPIIEVAVDEYEEWCRPWRNTLIVNLLGKNVGLRYMSNKLYNLWARAGTVQVMDMNNNFSWFTFLLRGIISMHCMKDHDVY